MFLTLKSVVAGSPGAGKMIRFAHKTFDAINERGSGAHENDDRNRDTPHDEAREEEGVTLYGLERSTNYRAISTVKLGTFCERSGAAP